MSVVAFCLLGLLLGATAPVLIRVLPEPLDSADDEEPTELTERAAMPTLELWGMRVDDGTKETYVAIAALRSVRVGCTLAGGLLGVLLGALYGFDPIQALLLPLVPVGLALSVIDWRTRLLPTRLVWPATLVAVLTGLALWPLHDAGSSLRGGLIGLATSFAIYWVMWFLVGIGYGDVRLAALVGFVLGYVGWAQWLLGMWAGTVLFSVPGLLIALVSWNRLYLKVGFPFGPFMLLGMVVGLVFGDPLVTTLLAESA